MREIIDVARKVLAMILIVALIAINLPTDAIWAKPSEKETITVYVKVLDADGNNILDENYGRDVQLEFAFSDGVESKIISESTYTEELTIVNPSVTTENISDILNPSISTEDLIGETTVGVTVPCYKLVLKKDSDIENFNITVSEKENATNTTKITYSQGEEFMTAQLVEYAILENNGVTFVVDYEKNTATYSVSKKYKDIDESKYTLNFEHAVDSISIISEDGATEGVGATVISVDDTKMVWEITNIKPGTTKLEISSSKNDFNITYFNITLSNNISFAKSNETIHIGNLTSNIIELDMDYEYADSIIFDSNKEDFVNLYIKDGEVYLKIIGFEEGVSEMTCDITAKCSITGEEDTCSYTLKEPNSDIIMKNGNDWIPNYGTINLDAWDMCNETIQVVGTLPWAFTYSINYDVSSQEHANEELGLLVADVANDGTVTIKGGGSATIGITATNLIFPWITKYNQYTINVNQKMMDVDVYNSETNTIIDTENDVIVLVDELKESQGDIEIDAVTGEEILKLPLSYQLKYKENGCDVFTDKDENVTVTYESQNLKITGNVVTVADDIIRNEEFTVTMIIHDNLGRFADIQKTIRFMLKSDRTKNENNKYYTVEGLVTGYDDHLWVNAINKTVVAKSTIEGEYTFKIEGVIIEWVDKYIVPYEDVEPYNKEHRITIAPKLGDGEVTRLYFGVDCSAPVIDEDSVKFIVNGKEIENFSGNYNGKIQIKVVASDLADGTTVDNLHIAYLKNGEEILDEAKPYKNADGKDEFLLTLKAPINATSYDNLYIQVDDIAKNSAIKQLGEVLLEQDAPSATINLHDGSTIDYTNADGKKYSDEDVYVDISLTDLEELVDANMSSGLASYEITVDGGETKTISKVYTDKQTADVLTIYTGHYMKAADGRITISVNKITDKAGNEWTPSGEDVITYTIYIDKDGATAVYSTTVTNGTNNTTSYGNFYNKEITYVFNVSDNTSGVENVVLKIGNKTYNGIIEGGVARVTVKVGAVGEATLELKDKVGNPTTIKLNELKNVGGTNAFTSNYVLVENDLVKEPSYTVRQADKGNWYKSQVDLDIAITDEISGKVSSGLASVKIYINDKEYQTNIYNSKDAVKDTFKVNIDNQWINNVINNAGTYTIKVVITDNAGNESVYNKTLHIDTVSPVISDLAGVVDGSINTGTVTVDVEVSEKHYKEAGNKTVVTVTKTHDGQTVTYEADPFTLTGQTTERPYTFTEDGFYTVVVTAEDAAGNQAVSKSISFRIDNTAPLADITGVTENSFYQDKADVTINVTESYYEDMNVLVDISIELNGELRRIGNVLFDGTQKNSSLAQTFTEEGKYTIKVDAVDAAGNVALTKTVMFTVDTSAPTISISGVKDGTAYKGDIIPVININDNYYKNYSISLVKTGVYFNEDLSNVDSMSGVDLTDTFMSSLTDVKNGAEGTFDTFEKVQSNDGIYTLTVTATDYAGRVSRETVHFTVNRFGSVYTFDDNLKNIINTVKTTVDTDLKITEYNADKLVADSVNIRITRDGSPLDEVIVEKSSVGTDNATGESGWYQYEYVISKENFKLDGVYVITVSSADEAGNNSENITYDELSIRFSVDTTKPEVIKINGLSDSVYKVDKQVVDYEIFDAVGIKEVKVYLGNECIQTVSNFDDITSYAGSFTISNGENQHIRFVVEDMAGNVIDSDNAEDVKLGKIVDFNADVTISTDVFVLWYANKPLFYGTIAATGSVAAGGSAAIVLRRRKLRLKIKK
ncbi:MAG: hypothetical protein IJF37_10360 [Lachnospiraceae bacterium]|nr:hypothetical protein [Lachnospiraceae bacterium]